MLWLPGVRALEKFHLICGIPTTTPNAKSYFSITFQDGRLN